MADPWVKFYTTDWRADPCLKMCSMAARGLWIDMICLMHEAIPYGHLLVNGQRPTDLQLSVLVGAPPDQITALLGELESAGVFSRTRNGTIYSRKLSRMAKKVATARNNGRKGGNPSLRKETENQPLDKGEVKPEDKPQKPEARNQTEEKEEPNGSSQKKASRLSNDWRLPVSWGEWAVSAGMDEVGVRREADRFSNYWQSKGGKDAAKLDWLKVWKNWISKALDDRRTAVRPSTPKPGEMRELADGRCQSYDPFLGWIKANV